MDLARRIPILLTVALLLASGGCWKARQALNPYPTDAVSIESFNRNRGHYEEIILLLAQDPDIHNLDANGRAESRELKPIELPEERRRRYKALMEATGTLHVNRWSWKPDSKCVSFQMWWVPNGPLMGSKAKYLIYKDDTEHRQFVDSLDPIYESGRDAGDYRRIDDDWSLFLDVW